MCFGGSGKQKSSGGKNVAGPRPAASSAPGTNTQKKPKSTKKSSKSQAGGSQAESAVGGSSSTHIRENVGLGTGNPESQLGGGGPGMTVSNSGGARVLGNLSSAIRNPTSQPSIGGQEMVAGSSSSAHVSKGSDPGTGDAESQEEGGGPEMRAGGGAYASTNPGSAIRSAKSQLSGGEPKMAVGGGGRPHAWEGPDPGTGKLENQLMDGRPETSAGSSGGAHESSNSSPAIGNSESRKWQSGSEMAVASGSNATRYVGRKDSLGSCGSPSRKGEGSIRDEVLDEVQGDEVQGINGEAELRAGGGCGDACDSITTPSVLSHITQGNYDRNAGSDNILGNGNRRFLDERTIVNQITIVHLTEGGRGGQPGSTSTPAGNSEVAPCVPWMVAYSQNEAFTSRDDIIRRVKKQDQIGRHNRIALWGLGGTGKTQIVLAYVYGCEGRHPVFWVHGSSLEKFSQEFKNIIPYVGVSQATSNVESPLTLVKKWFESQGSGKWILVVDNADNESDFKYPDSPIAQYIPQGGKGTLIITTRSKFVASRLGCHGDNAIEVKGMEEKEARQLFLSRYGVLKHSAEPPTDKRAVEDILRLLHYLPLAVVGAAAYMTETSTRPSQYLGMFKSENDVRENLLSQEFSDIYREVVESTLSTFFITFEQIKKLDNLAMDLLRLITFLNDHQNIPEDVLQVLCFDLTGMNDPVTARNAIGKLESYSLLTKTAGSVGNLSRSVYELHHMVQISAEVYIKKRERLNVSMLVNTARRAEELASQSRPSSFVSPPQQPGNNLTPGLNC